MGAFKFALAEAQSYPCRPSQYRSPAKTAGWRRNRQKKQRYTMMQSV